MTYEEMHDRYNLLSDRIDALEEMLEEQRGEYEELSQMIADADEERYGGQGR